MPADMIPTHFVPWLSLLPALVLSTGDPGPPVPSAPPQVNATDECVPDGEFEPVTLAQLWSEQRSLEPGYLAVEERVEAERATRAATRREWLPSGSVDGLGTYGQRLSPGEERVLGVGPRGELRLLTSWTLLDSDRARRVGVADARIQEATSAVRAFRVTHEAGVAQAYVRGAAAEQRWGVHQAHMARLEELAELVRLRVAAGVELGWEEQLLEEALARGRRLAVEAEIARDGSRIELSHHAGRCVRADPIAPDVSTPLLSDPADGGPDVRRLRQQAEISDALAREAVDRGRWQVQVLGIVGPNHSRAFDDGNVENEYLLGLAGRWQPDLAGVRRQLAGAERARAGAIRAEAESLRLALVRELDQLRVRLDHGGRQLDLLTAELEEARRREEVAFFRWREGVDRWVELMQARDRVLEPQLLDVTLKEELAAALVRGGEITGTLADVPERLSREPTR